MATWADDNPKKVLSKTKKMKTFMLRLESSTKMSLSHSRLSISFLIPHLNSDKISTSPQCFDTVIFLLFKRSYVYYA